MSELLIEIYSEEIPAKMQSKAANDFKNLCIDFFAKQNIKFSESNLKSFVTPRRLVFLAENLDKFQITPEIKKIGPKIDAPEKAIEGFLKSVGVSDIEKLEKITRDNGEYYFYTQPESKIATREILEKNLPAILQKMSTLWPKSMKWKVDFGSTSWVRPIRNILAIFDKEIINISFSGLQSNNKTFGHLFLSNKILEVKDFAEYQKKLIENFVVLDLNQRKEIIISQIKEICKKINCSTIDNLEENNVLLNEVVGLTEYPVAMFGRIEEKFMSLPSEVLILTVKNHQKYFCLKDSKGHLASYFIFVSNVKADQKSEERIIADNEKVLRARLSDAKFFIDEDLKVPFISRLEGLREIIFHEKLGSLYAKAKRLESLNKFVSMWVPHCNLALAETVADLAKNDLITKTVAELPELQGVIGKYYAAANNYQNEISIAIEEQYLPSGANGTLPQTPLGAMLSIADKMDTICGLFLAGEKPTSSKDPFALRRAAIGILRIICEYKISLPLKIIIDKSLNSFSARTLKRIYPDKSPAEIKDIKHKVSLEILSFFAERSKSMLKDNLRADIVNEVFDVYLVNINKEKSGDLLDLVTKANFINNFVIDKSNSKIIELYKRAANIVSIEEKKDQREFKSKPNILLLKTKYEKSLYKKTKSAENEIKKLLKDNKYNEAFKILSDFELPLNQFFDNVIVNTEEENLRINRLLILAKIRNLFNNIFNFSKVEF